MSRKIVVTIHWHEHREEKSPQRAQTSIYYSVKQLTAQTAH